MFGAKPMQDCEDAKHEGSKVQETYCGPDSIFRCAACHKREFDERAARTKPVRDYGFGVAHGGPAYKAQ